MADVSGFLLKVTEKEIRNGGKIYSIQVEVADSGKDEWFGFGFDKPHFGVDSEIEFDVEERGDYENVVNDSLVVVDMQNEPAKERKSRSGSGGGSSRKPRGGSDSTSKRSPRGGKSDDKPERKPRGGADKPATKKADVDWDRKDNLIRLQSCQNTAVATVSLQLAAGTLALPKKKGEQYDALAALVEKEAHRLFLKYDDCADGTYDHDGDEEGGTGKDNYDEEIPE